MIGLRRGVSQLRHLLTALIALSLTAGAASAQSVRVIGDFRDWSAYAATEGSGPLCFAMSRPRETSPEPDGFTGGYLYLTNRPNEGLAHEFNLVAGYTFAPDTPAMVTISGQSFALFTDKDAAWLDDPAQAENLAGVMRAGSTLSIEGTTDKGIKVVQTYSLSGATAASRAIDTDCV